MEDSALVEAAQAGDQIAFERLLRRHQGLLDAHASRFYLPGGDQDDGAQDAHVLTRLEWSWASAAARRHRLCSAGCSGAEYEALERGDDAAARRTGDQLDAPASGYK